MSTAWATNRDDLIKLLETYEGRKEFIEDKEPGLEVKFIRENHQNNAGYWLEKCFPNSTITIDKKDCKNKKDFEAALNWPRDILQVLKNTALIAPRYKTLGNKILNELGFNGERELSHFGEGGTSVVAGKGLLFSGIDLLFDKVEIVDKMDYLAIAMPLYAKLSSQDSVERRLARRLNRNRHIDTEMNLIQTKADKYLLIVTPEYHHVFKETVDLICSSTKNQLYVTKDSHHYQPTNFIVLPSGKIIISEKCKSVIDFLDKNLDTEILTYKPLRNECNRYGGLRCRTNIIEI